MAELSKEAQEALAARSPRSLVPDPHPSIHRVKAARRIEQEVTAAPAKEADAALLKELDGLLREHAGHEVIDAAKVTLHHDKKNVIVDVPKHCPVTVRFIREEGKPVVMKFDVLRGRGTRTFDHLGDALIFGEPRVINHDLPPIRPTFNTAKLPPELPPPEIQDAPEADKPVL